jgi:exopolysaccharide biosynthesis protein
LQRYSLDCVKRIISVVVGGLLLCCFPLITKAERTAPEGMGTALYQSEVAFAPKAVYHEYVAQNQAEGIEHGFTIQFKPSDNKLKMIAAYGERLYGGDTLTQFMKHEEEQGYTVFGGINADGFNINTGVPDGPMIHDGRLVAYPNQDFCIGFTPSGKFVSGLIQLDFNLKLSSGDLKVSHLNADMGESGCYLFSREFSDSTKNKVYPSFNVICDIFSGRQAIGQTLTLKVTDIRDRDLPADGDMAIAENQIVIAVAKTDKNQEYINALRTLTIGESFQLEIRDEVSTVGGKSAWTAVQEAMGTLSVILQDGKVVTTDTNVHPRTCLGTKSDGTIVLYVLDGRRPGYSMGLNLLDAAEFLRRQGCVTAVNLDGGGSSTMAVRKPGAAELTILNQPSDGKERPVGNAWILASRMAGNGKFEHIHLENPVNSFILAGATLDFSCKGTDSAYMPVPLPTPPVWSIKGNIGSIDDNGKFTAAEVAGRGNITVKSAGKSATAGIRVVQFQDIDCHFNIGSLAANSGSTHQLMMEATSDNFPVICQNAQFTWSVTGDIGTIDQDGLFTAASGSGLKGTIVAAYGSKSCKIPVTVGKLPLVIADFENGTAGWTLTQTKIPAGGLAMREETAEELVCFGKKSLKLEYNMVGGLSGTAGCYLKANPVMKIDGYPTAIGMWVYGDGKRHWLRGMLQDGAGAHFDIDFTPRNEGVNWIGWKYVEAAIPQDKILPLAIYTPVRYIETDNHKKTAGVLYIDNIRLIYGYKNDDMTAPIIKCITPVDGTTLTGYTNIRVSVSDADSGIDAGRIKFYVDDLPKDDYIYNETAGNIQWNTKGLSEGKHQFKLKIRDNFGNQAEQTWYYTWETEEIQDFSAGGAPSEKMIDQ